MGARKTAEQMNAERRANKARRRKTGAVQKQEGFSMQATVKDKRRREHFQRQDKETVQQLLQEALTRGSVVLRRPAPTNEDARSGEFWQRRCNLLITHVTKSPERSKLTWNIDWESTGQLILSKIAV